MHGDVSYKVYNCTVSNNFCAWWGGGVYGESLFRCQVLNNLGSNGGGIAFGFASHCVFRGNTGTNTGGAYGSSAANAPNLYNCLFVANSAQASGFPGGAGSYAFLHNCTVVSNSAAAGPGGLGANAVATNCIVTDNYRPGSGVSNYSGSAAFAYSCTYPMPTGAGDAGGNTASAPGFRNPAAGDYHLTSQSPCVNSGTNEVWLNDTTDLDGGIRIRYGRVDMGCYECLYQGAIFSGR